MKSPFTGEPMELITEKRIISVREEDFEVNYTFYRCKDTQEEFFTPEMGDVNYGQAYDQYKALHPDWEHPKDRLLDQIV